MRVVRICSRPEDRESRLQELKTRLLSRGYERGMLEMVIAWASTLDRNELLDKVVREKNEERIRYITTYDPRMPAIPAILTKSWKIMVERDPRLPQTYP